MRTSLTWLLTVGVFLGHAELGRACTLADDYSRREGETHLIGVATPATALSDTDGIQFLELSVLAIGSQQDVPVEPESDIVGQLVKIERVGGAKSETLEAVLSAVGDPTVLIVPWDIRPNCNSAVWKRPEPYLQVGTLAFVTGSLRDREYWADGYPTLDAFWPSSVRIAVEDVEAAEFYARFYEALPLHDGYSAIYHGVDWRAQARDILDWIAVHPDPSSWMADISSRVERIMKDLMRSMSNERRCVHVGGKFVDGGFVLDPEEIDLDVEDPDTFVIIPHDPKPYWSETGLFACDASDLLDADEQSPFINDLIDPLTGDRIGRVLELCELETRVRVLDANTLELDGSDTAHLRSNRSPEFWRQHGIISCEDNVFFFDPLTGDIAGTIDLELWPI